MLVRGIAGRRPAVVWSRDDKQLDNQTSRLEVGRGGAEVRASARKVATGPMSWERKCWVRKAGQERAPRRWHLLLKHTQCCTQHRSAGVITLCSLAGTMCTIQQTDDEYAFISKHQTQCQIPVAQRIPQRHTFIDRQHKSKCSSSQRKGEMGISPPPLLVRDTKSPETNVKARSSLSAGSFCCGSAVFVWRVLIWAMRRS